MKAFLSSVLLCLLALPCRADDPPAKVPGLELPANAQVAADAQFVRLTGVTKGKSIKWLVRSSVKVKWLAVSPLSIDVGCPPGATIKVFGTAVVDGEPTDYACTVLTVAGAPPPIPPPPPVDALKQALATAWTAETDPKRVANVEILAALYDQASRSYVDDPTYKTVGDLFKVMVAASQKAIPGSIPKIHRAAGDWLNKEIGQSATAPLDAALRGKLKAAFTQLSLALGGLK